LDPPFSGYKIVPTQLVLHVHRLYAGGVVESLQVGVHLDNSQRYRSAMESSIVTSKETCGVVVELEAGRYCRVTDSVLVLVWFGGLA